MRRAALAVAVVVAMTSLLHGADAPAFKEYSSKEGKFKALLPGTPKEQTVDAGPVKMHMAIVDLGKDVSYTVIYSDLPGDAKTLAKPEVAEKVLDGATKGALDNTKGKNLTEKKIKIGTYPGREIQFEIPDKGFVRSRIYLVDARLYQVMVTGPKATITSKDADKFLGSFKLSK